MDNAIVVDGAIALVLIAGTVIGAKRGLIKCLMGLLVLIGAMFGSVWLADLMTPPVADIVAPKVEDAIVEKFSELVEQGVNVEGGALADELSE